MRPLIGIPPCLDESGRWRPGREYLYVDGAYARAVAEAGGLPVLLPLQGRAAELVARLDGLLVPGGDDLPPDRPYPAGVRFDLAPERQVAFDAALVDVALARDLPVLAICYGMQLLALRCGGALHFDLACDLPDAGPHRLADPDARHPLRVERGSRLAELFGDGPLAVNSRHHQAVADAGRARVSAVAEDGVAEALELPGPRFAVGVQWHPESMETEHRRRLFGGFLAACREARQEADGAPAAGAGGTRERRGKGR